MTIWDSITKIKKSKIYLPAIQRKFVWNRKQIELLFDSIMRNYPIGTFLFWRLNKEMAKSYVFYEFLRDYDERTPYNRRNEGGFTSDEIIGVLDGQQRLSSIYVGLMGTHVEKAPYKWRASSNAYEKMHLYVNLLSLPYELNEEGAIEINEEKYFEFKFLTSEKATSSIVRNVKTEDGTNIEEAMYWLRLSDVTTWPADPDFEHLLEQLLDKCHAPEQINMLTQNKRFVRKCIETLHKRIFQEELINYFDINGGDLDDILKIFVRVNSGGTVLNKTDLLFSTIVATWSDGRDKIEDLLKTINVKGDGFSFGNDFLMRCCLILTDGPVRYKVNSFRSDNVKIIQDEWIAISQAIIKTVDILVEFGFNGDRLSSQNAVILISYYIFKGGQINNIAKDNLRRYLIHALLTQVFGSSVEQLFTALLDCIREKNGDVNANPQYKLKSTIFSFEEILKADLPARKSLSVSETDIEEFLTYKKGAQSFFLLSLLYPNLRFHDTAFHQDHIHPAAGFNSREFSQMGLSKQEQNYWISLRDTLPNLQLMYGKDNIKKSATSINNWLSSKKPQEIEEFKKNNYFPDSVDLSFSNFIDFFEKRKAMLREELKNVLSLNVVDKTPTIDDWERQDETIEGDPSFEEEIIKSQNLCEFCNVSAATEQVERWDTLLNKRWAVPACSNCAPINRQTWMT